jgi:TPP-dependent pyruvate/acetoin dehydrogenase alpha subunit
MATKIKKEPGAVITYFGDGATSEGDLHEAMNFASVAQAPLVFLCQNNQYAISTPLCQQSHSSTLAQRALAYDMPGLVVDGNDVLAMYRATEEAMERARSGQGPSFIEALTYRIGAHTTSDDPGRYRDESEVAAWRLRDPLLRFEKYLLKKNILKEGEKERIQDRFAQEMKQQAMEAEAICERLSPDEMFSYLFKNMPEVLREQRNEMLHQTQQEEEGILHA